MSLDVISIIGGPAKPEIIERMFGISSPVQFQILESQPHTGLAKKIGSIELMMFSVTKEDGSGNRFLIEGYWQSKKVRLYYDTNTSTGHVTQISKSAVR